MASDDHLWAEQVLQSGVGLLAIALDAGPFDKPFLLPAALAFISHGNDEMDGLREADIAAERRSHVHVKAMKRSEESRSWDAEREEQRRRERRQSYETAASTIADIAHTYRQAAKDLENQRNSPIVDTYKQSAEDRSLQNEVKSSTDMANTYKQSADDHLLERMVNSPDTELRELATKVLRTRMERIMASQQ